MSSDLEARREARRRRRMDELSALYQDDSPAAPAAAVSTKCKVSSRRNSDSGGDADAETKRKERQAAREARNREGGAPAEEDSSSRRRSRRPTQDDTPAEEAAPPAPEQKKRTAADDAADDAAAEERERLKEEARIAKEVARRKEEQEEAEAEERKAAEEIAREEQRKRQAIEDEERRVREAEEAEERRYQEQHSRDYADDYDDDDPQSPVNEPYEMEDSGYQETVSHDTIDPYHSPRYDKTSQSYKYDDTSHTTSQSYKYDTSHTTESYVYHTTQADDYDNDNNTQSYDYNTSYKTHDYDNAVKQYENEIDSQLYDNETENDVQRNDDRFTDSKYNTEPDFDTNSYQYNATNDDYNPKHDDYDATNNELNMSKDSEHDSYASNEANIVSPRDISPDRATSQKSQKNYERDLNVPKPSQRPNNRNNTISQNDRKQQDDDRVTSPTQKDSKHSKWRQWELDNNERDTKSTITNKPESAQKRDNVLKRLKEQSGTKQPVDETARWVKKKDPRALEKESKAPFEKSDGTKSHSGEFEADVKTSSNTKIQKVRQNSTDLKTAKTDRLKQKLGLEKDGQIDKPILPNENAELMFSLSPKPGKNSEPHEQKFIIPVSQPTQNNQNLHGKVHENLVISVDNTPDNESSTRNYKRSKNRYPDVEENYNNEIENSDIVTLNDQQNYDQDYEQDDDDASQRIQEEKEEAERVERERKREEIKAKEEEATKGKKRKAGLTPEKKKLLKQLIMQKAAEDLRNEAKRKAEEKELYINKQVAPIGTLEDLKEADLQKLCKEMHQQLGQLEDVLYDNEQKVRKQDWEINELTLKVNDTKGKFIKPVLRKINKTETKLDKLGKKERDDFRSNLKSTGQSKYALEDDSPKTPDWREELEQKEADPAAAE